MALIKCKECQKDVSDKAKKCPNCGAKVVKPVGPLGIIFVLIVGWFFYSAFSTDSSTSTAPKVSSNQNDSAEATDPTPDKSQKPKTAWNTTVSVDEMTGKTQAFAYSKSVSPTRQMDFPYSNVEAWVGVGCDGSSEWAYFGFTTAPNLTNDDTKDGYNLISTRVKWNDSIENTRLTQDWGSKFIHFSNKSAAISKITSSSSMMLELQWHGQGRVNFAFPLKGSSEAIQEMRLKCK